MAVNATHSTFFNGNSAISFRALQTKFGGSVNNVKFSTYKRNTSLNNANPIVPDATENGNIPTTNSDISSSQYRGSIKQYILTQTGTDVNLTFHQNAYSASTHHWNSNLGKNVIKIFKLNGKAIASSTSQYALKFNGTGYNLSANISGTVAGFRGAGASSGSGGNGGNGGPAFYVYNSANTSFNTAQFHATITGIVAGGGGGGGAGRKGSANTKRCRFNSSSTARSNKSKESGGTVCRSARCPSTITSSGISGSLNSQGGCDKRGSVSPRRDRGRKRRRRFLFWGGGRNRKGRRDVKGRGCHGRARANDCWSNANKNCSYNHNYRISAAGGFGGAGGDGYGSDGSSIRTKNNGNPGSLGNTTNCSSVVSGVSNSTTGQAGSSGGNGGKKGQSGGAGSNSGGNPGRSITGRRISFNGTVGTNIFGPLQNIP